MNPPYPAPIIRDNYCCFTSKSGYQWAPTDLLYISGILNGDKRFTVKVIDAPGERISEDTTRSRIEHINPDIICCLTGTVSFERDMELLQNYKKLHKKTKIFVLGNTPCFAPVQFLKQFPFIDGIFHNFMDKSLKNVFIGKPNLCKTFSYRKGSKFSIGQVNLAHPQAVINGINPPLYGQFPFKNYSSPVIKNRPFITIITTFGCPFSCSFCIASRLDYHPRDIGEIQKEMKTMKKIGIREIFFIDSTFNADSAFVNTVLDMMIKKDFRFTWSAQIHSFNVTPALIRKMKKAGCHTIQIGVESGSGAVLKEYAPSKVKEKITAAIQICKKEGVRVLGYFIIGFLNESKKQVLETIAFAKKLDPEFASFSTLTPDYGTKTYDFAIKKHLLKAKKKGLALNRFDSSDSSILNNRYLSSKDQDELVQKAYREFYFQPKKLLSYLMDFSHIGQYVQNGLFLISKKILNK